MSAALSAESLAALMPGRPIRAYPALLSTEAEALAWARSGGEEGAVVVAGYQASPRGRSGLTWTIAEDRGLGFSMILRPGFLLHREGWLYTVAVSGLADALGDDTTIEWPDQVRRGDTQVGGVGIQTHQELLQIDWAVVNVMATDAWPDRGGLMASIVEAVEDRYRSEPVEVMADYRLRLETLGRRVRAHLIPMGPAGPQVEGRAVDVRDDGALIVETSSGTRPAVLPQQLGRLEAC